MTSLVLTMAGPDRDGLVATVAEIVRSHGGNWEASRLTELAGVFAGVAHVTVPDERIDDVRAALRGLTDLLAVTVTTGTGAPAVAPRRDQDLQLTVLGNDRPGIVREVSSVLHAHGVSIDRMETSTRDAAMAGGRLFEAEVVGRVAEGRDALALHRDLERLAAEIQVDIDLR